MGEHAFTTMPGKQTTPQVVPAAWRSCFRLMRLHHFPVGTKLPFTSLALSMLMGSRSIHTPSQSLGPVYAKAFVWWLYVLAKHSAACVWNDICDRDIDNLVERTKNRPLASGQISLRAAGVLFSVLLLLAQWLLKLAIGDVNIFLISLACTVGIDMPYPLMKRWLNMPQMIVASAMVWPIPVAWMSVTGGEYDLLTIVMLCIAFGGIAFILDTIYACQDLSDDVKAGVRSAAITLGDQLRSTLLIIAVVVVASFAVAGVVNGQGPLNLVISLGGLATVLGSQLCAIDFRNKEQCGKALTAYSNQINAVIWVAAIGGSLITPGF